MPAIASIGPFLFHEFKWPAALPSYQQEVNVLQQIGTDNADFRLVGFHSREFTIETEVNLLTEAAAWDLLLAPGGYKEQTSQVPLQVVYYGENFDTREFRLKVLNVDGGALGFPAVRRVGCIGGGVNPNGFNTLLTATWQVKWVKTT